MRAMRSGGGGVRRGSLLGAQTMNWGRVVADVDAALAGVAERHGMRAEVVRSGYILSCLGEPQIDRIRSLPTVFASMSPPLPVPLLAADAHPSSSVERAPIVSGQDGGVSRSHYRPGPATKGKPFNVGASSKPTAVADNVNVAPPISAPPTTMRKSPHKSYACDIEAALAGDISEDETEEGDKEKSNKTTEPSLKKGSAVCVTSALVAYGGGSGRSVTGAESAQAAKAAIGFSRQAIPWLAPNYQTKAVITAFESLDHFWVRLTKDRCVPADFFRSSTAPELLDPITVENARSGQPCMARRHTLKNWERGRIEYIDKLRGLVTVRLVDSGFLLESVHIDHVKAMPKSYAEKPPLVYHCQLNRPDWQRAFEEYHTAVFKSGRPGIPMFERNAEVEVEFDHRIKEYGPRKQNNDELIWHVTNVLHNGRDLLSILSELQQQHSSGISVPSNTNDVNQRGAMVGGRRVTIPATNDGRGGRRFLTSCVPQGLVDAVVQRPSLLNSQTSHHYGRGDSNEEEETVSPKMILSRHALVPQMPPAERPSTIIAAEETQPITTEDTRVQEEVQPSVPDMIELSDVDEQHLDGEDVFDNERAEQTGGSVGLAKQPPEKSNLVGQWLSSQPTMKVPPSNSGDSAESEN